MSIKGRTIQVNDIDLNVAIDGEGPAVLLLHGFPDSAYLWRNQIPILADNGYRVIVPDQRGFGDSDRPEGKDDYALEKIVGDAVALLDMLEVEKISLVGHDFGALVGWGIAMTHPERVDRYAALSVGHPTAYATASIEQKEKGWYALLFQFEGLSEQFLTAEDWYWFRELLRHHPEIDHWIEDLSRPGRLPAALNWYRANLFSLLTSDYPKVQVPVMGIWSTGDFYLTEAQMQNSESFVQAPWRYERIEDAGHWIPLDAPGRLNDLLLDFLS